MTVPVRLVLSWVFALYFAMLPARSSAQTSQAVQRITTAIDDQNLTVLHGNVPPMARAEADQGAVSDAQVLHRMLLLLQRGPEQEAALQQLLSDQQSKSSGRYQNWLTPEQFGAQFGPSDADIQTVTQWLASQGFTGIAVGAGRTTIEFSGTAGQVRSAFHTQMRRYALKSEVHFANASDPAIPTALGPVVAGVVSLNNFPIQSHLHRMGTFQKSLKTGETPLFTLACGGGLCFGLGPADFAKIYNSQPLLSGSPKIDGTGQGIAIVGESNIKVQDVVDFRTMFGLAQNFSSSNVIVNGEDPGITDSEDESDLDVQWSGAVAPGARIDFVTSAPTETTAGINLSALYIVDHNLDAVMSESFGACEKTNGTTMNQFLNSLWEQASAQGITVIVSAGDSGSAGCDDFNTQQTAMQGLAVSGFASTPYNVAVGGTDFDQKTSIPTYWNTTQTSLANQPIPASAKSYIPEIPWNDTCATGGISGCTAANATGIAAGSGGVSTLYAKPSWQAGKGVPADGHRDVPDISLFAGDGSNYSFYIICQSDVTQVPNCNLNAFQVTFQGVGGTSASAPAFAGIVALVNQKLAAGGNPEPRQGNANYFLYALAQQQVTANLSCNSSSSPVAGCSFNDVTKGNNDVPCAGASTNCSGHVAGTPGVLVAAATPTVPAFTTTAGYDLATGLGSLNVQNVVNKWSTVNTTSTTTALTLNGGAAVNVTHGAAVPYQISVGPATASGDASLVATPTGNTVGIGPFTLTSGAASGTTTALPGGTSYNVVAHYEGNGTDAPSDSSPVAVTVAAEPSKVFITVPTFNPETGQQTGTSPTTLVYGSPYILRADVTNATGSLSSLCKPPSCPSGTITFADTVGGISQGAPNSGTFTLNSSGFTEDQPVQFPGGSNVITATYSGDGSFSASAQPATYTLNVTPAPTQTGTPTSGGGTVGDSVTMSATMTTNITTGAAPGGAVTFFDGTTSLGPDALFLASPGNGTNGAQVFAIATPVINTPGTHSITAHYTGDANYAASTSAAISILVRYQTVMTAVTQTNSINLGQSVQVAVSVTTTGKNPAMTGTFGIFNTSLSFPSASSVDSSGNQTLTGTVTYTPDKTGVIPITYSGDGNYFGASTTAYVTVVLPDFSMSSTDSMVITKSQTPVTATVTITPANSVASVVALACGGSPDLSPTKCTVSPTSVSLNGQPVNVSVTFNVGEVAGSAPNAVRAKAKRRALMFPFWQGRPSMSLGLVSLGFVLLVASLWPGRKRKALWRVGFAGASVALLAIGCGGGSSSSGGGGSTLAATTTTLSIPNPNVPLNGTMSATATVTGSTPLTGTVSFFLVNIGEVPGQVPVTGGIASAQFTLVPQLGFYEVYAMYSGDATNKASQSSNVPVAVTGSTFIGIEGTNNAETQSVTIPVSIQ
jgi:Pro-kumamolisin, activation domain/Bacterial Ig-like domain (group 3)